MGFQFPIITKAQARDYEKKACHMGRSIKPILHDTTMQFATDFCNIVIHSIAQDMAFKMKAIQDAKARLSPPVIIDAETVPEKPESSIVLAG